MRRGNRPSVNRRQLLILGAAVAVLVVLSVLALAKKRADTTVRPSPTPSINYSPASTADNSQSEESKNQPPATGQPSSAPAASAFDVHITGANVAAGNVHIGTLVSATAGSCSLTASKAGQATVQLGTSTVRQNVNEYDCGVFNVPTSSFPGGGAWTLSLKVTNGSQEGTGTYAVTIP